MSGTFGSWLGLAEVSPLTLSSLTEGAENPCSAWSVVVVVQHDSVGQTSSHASITSIHDNNDDDAQTWFHHMLTTTVVQVVPSPALNDGLLYVHPVLYEVLQHATVVRLSLVDPKGIQPHKMQSVTEKVLSLAPIPALSVMDTSNTSTTFRDHRAEIMPSWKIVLPGHVCDLPLKSQISVNVLHVDEEYDDDEVILLASNTEKAEKDSFLLKGISESLLGRYITEGVVLVLSLMGGRLAVVVITKLQQNNVAMEERMSDGIVYRVGTSREEYSVHFDKKLQSHGVLITNPLPSTSIPDESSYNSHEDEEDCPGYESLLQELLHYATMMKMIPQVYPLDTSDISASGIFLTGCAGVGKTRLASCLSHRLRNGTARHHETSGVMQVHWVSVHDLLLRASHETNLVHHILPPTMSSSAMEHSGCLIIIDDLHVLERSTDHDDAVMDIELLLVRNAILQSMDKRPCNCMFLALGQSVKQLPPELIRIGRLEQQLIMHPPTQSQRKAILIKLLSCLPETNQASTSHCELLERWTEILAASPTAGCVAADLRRLCTDALTKALARRSKQPASAEMTSGSLLGVLAWEDLREAARQCIPSQLAQLDVTKPTSWLDEHPADGAAGAAAKITPDLTRLRHEQSWRRFGGYPEVKKRIYRTVVGPWSRHLNETGTGFGGTNLLGMHPPKGVLFHGPSGCGKTLAATCLASSLGLAVVKVRSSDVLDKWLGGSEAILRSLFERAGSSAPCILFFDELDAIAANRASSDQASSDVSSRLLSTFLNEMDGISSSANARVLVVACSNRLEALDAALLRPGRLEEHVLLAAPTLSDVQEILKLCTQRMPLSSDVDFAELAQTLLPVTGADIEGVCREACYFALRRLEGSQDVVISRSDFDGAIKAWM